MKTYTQSLGADVWDVVEEEYQKCPIVIMKYQKVEFTCNAKAMNSLLVGLPKSELVKVMDCTFAKSIRDKMSSFYEGESMVNKVKLQGFRMQFESLKMHDDEDIIKNFLRVDEVVNTIRGLDEKLDEYIVVKKVLRYLLERFNPKVSTIEKMTNLNTLTIYQILGTLITYEIIIYNRNSSTKESTFKVNKSKEDLDNSCCE